MKRAILLLSALCMTACASGVKVNAWEKGDLAQPIMAFESDSHDARLIQHVRVSKEAASGGYGVGGGGCGCN
jgi:uncharacterized lipoprotein YmbA